MADHRDVLSPDLSSHGSRSSTGRSDLLKFPINEGSKITGYHVLRDYQKKVVEAYLSGRDVFVSVPIGAGKSLTFELAP